MVVEMIVNRGWAVLIDGVQPIGGWVVGENGEVNDGNADNPGPLAIGNHRVTRFEFDRPLEGDWVSEDDLPTKLTLHFAHGRPPVELKVTFVVYGSTISGPLLVTTLDGKGRWIDEITTYIRAEG